MSKEFQDIVGARYRSTKEYPAGRDVFDSAMEELYEKLEKHIKKHKIGEYAVQVIVSVRRLKK